MRYICSLITVSDIGVAREFYESVLQQKVKHDFGENITFEGDFAIHLRSHFSSLIDGKNINSESNSFELYFESDDIEAFASKLKERGIDFVHDVREQPWRQKVARFYDPDRNLIEVGESMESLSFRLSNEGKPIDEIARITSLPASFIVTSIERMRKAGHCT